MVFLCLSRNHLVEDKSVQVFYFFFKYGCIYTGLWIKQWVKKRCVSSIFNDDGVCEQDGAKENGDERNSNVKFWRILVENGCV